jgi:hypothetical protein
MTVSSRTSTADADSPWAEWRARRLQSAGFDATLAMQLAADRRIDLHPLLELVDRACPPALAARILAPDDARVMR